MRDDYDVGYKKPPKAGQYKKGQSGNPKGRKKGTKNLKTDLIEELAEQVELREGHRKVRISKQRALIKSLVARAIKGNDRAAGKLIDLYLKALGIEYAANDADVELSVEEQEVLKSLEARILKKAAEAPAKAKDDEHELS